MNAYRIFLENPEGKRPLGRPKRRWVDNIKMDVREIGCGGIKWIDLAWDRDQWEFVSLTRRPHFTPGKNPGTHFC
jgi:hypothetical protein